MVFAEDQALLALDDEFEAADVLVAYRRQALVLHPDAGGTDEQMVRLTEARDRLLDFCANGPLTAEGETLVAGSSDDVDAVVWDDDRDEAKLRFYLIPLLAFPLFFILLVAIANTISN